MILGLFLWGGLLRGAASPSVGAVTTGSSLTIGRYRKLELSFPVTTTATNPQLPYDPAAPPYATNLKPDEDARRGVSVDGLFLPPGRTDWTNALVQPGFLYRPYARMPALPNTNHTLEDLVASGPDAWKVRFAPTQTGKWQFRVRVTDAAGTETTSPRSFVCVPSDSRGFLRVSATDSRYFQFDNGESATLIGENLFFNGLDAFKASSDKVSGAGASALIRLWIAGRSGQEIIGGFANSSGGRVWLFSNGTQLLASGAHGGRFCVGVAAGNELTTKEVPLKPNRAYTVQAWVKPEGCSSLTLTTQDSDTYRNSRDSAVSLTNEGAWTRVSAPIAAHDPQNGANFFATVKFLPQGGGRVLVDDVQVTDDATGADVLEVGDFERHVHYSQRQSWLLDALVERAAQTGQYLRLNCLENDDSVFCNVSADAKEAPHSADNFYGRSTDPAADLAVRRWQRYYARYLVARWGYATSVAQWEFNNEGALFNGNHYAAAQNFARAIHGYHAEGHRPASTSFWQNSSGTSYPADFFDSPAFTDIDYADVHYYPGPKPDAGQFTPFNESNTFGHGFQRIPDGGPSPGLGCLRIDADSQQNGELRFPLNKLRGKGRWTVSYQGRTTQGVQIARYGNRGLDLAINSRSLGGSPWLSLPGLRMPKQPPAADFGWKTFRDTFVVPDDKAHPMELHLGTEGGFTHGRIEIADVKLTAPDGRVWARYTFSEPTMGDDTASLVTYLGLMYTPLSGDASLGKPLSIGETDIMAPAGDYDKQIERDQAGVFFRQFCWAHMNPSGATVFFFTHANGEATRRGLWKYAAAYQRFMRGIPLANGRYRSAEATASDPRLLVLGQQDSEAGRAHLFVRNREGNWRRLATEPGRVTPVSGAVTLAGLAPGAYTVETWDTSRGEIRQTQTLRATGAGLSVPIKTLASDLALKISPADAKMKARGQQLR